MSSATRPLARGEETWWFGVTQDFTLTGGIGIPDAEAHQEAIELRFGEWVGAVVFTGF